MNDSGAECSEALDPRVQVNLIDSFKGISEKVKKIVKFFLSFQLITEVYKVSYFKNHKCEYKNLVSLN